MAGGMVIADCIQIFIDWKSERVRRKFCIRIKGRIEPVSIGVVKEKDD